MLGVRGVMGPCGSEALGWRGGHPHNHRGLIRYVIKCVTANAPRAGFIKPISMLESKAKRKKTVTSFFLWGKKKWFKSVEGETWDLAEEGRGRLRARAPSSPAGLMERRREAERGEMSAGGGAGWDREVALCHHFLVRGR